MHLDPLTLMVPAVTASAIASLFVYGAWFRFRDQPALIWWGSAHALHTIGLALIFVSIASTNKTLTPVGGGLMSMAPLMIWAGVRRFLRLRALWPVVVGTPLVVPLITALPVDIDSETWSTAIGFGFWPVFLTASAWLLVRHRAEHLPARWVFGGFLMLHAIVYSLAVSEVLQGTFSFDQPPALNSPFGVIHFESILFSMAVSIVMIFICHERKEQRYVHAASIDPMTGAHNRGTFFEAAGRLFERDRRAGAPCSLIMFDLDRFKTINDDYGHQFGDRILASFAETVRSSLRPRDLFGRYGGEEFVVVLPGTSVKTAALIADRILKAFAAANTFVEGQPVKATVSAGVAQAGEAQDLQQVIKAADQAMYAAKRGGRNRVEIAPDAPPDPDVVRIA
ncbi:GGDEF domain-containing protein [Oricola sp.]|uniref:GGDEF domain-containing protein n=1 Tax=Oricola sp. TaxID=1979950 RepID=UPI0025D90E09|nr:GGDEF domain-containing protein [Oricola sp.]MCI5074784.1 GGDEF domain-containing protein [Oricola sp.]